VLAYDKWIFSERKGVAMYCDFSPDARINVDRILIIEDGDQNFYTIDEMVKAARNYDVVYIDGDGDEMFCYIIQGVLSCSNEQTFRSDILRWIDEKNRPNFDPIETEYNY